MISDVLSDAAHQIREYLTGMPEVYARKRPQIQGVLAAMDSLREDLDRLPPDTGLNQELLILLNEAVTLMPLGTAARAAWVSKAHVTIKAATE
jgi:hypothetical protein